MPKILLLGTTKSVLPNKKTVLVSVTKTDSKTGLDLNFEHFKLILKNVVVFGHS